MCHRCGYLESATPKKEPTKKVPQWPGLLEELFEAQKSRLSDQARQDCERLLRISSSSPPASSPSAKDWPSGPDLILVASILREVKPAEFDIAFREAVTNADNSYSETHLKLLDLLPAGILTFNYDSAHENSARTKGIALRPMTPGDEDLLRRALISSDRPFLLKAHGSLNSSSELVLTEESYRHVLVKSPAYRGFVQNVLTNASLVFVGFRMSDPDFDVFLNSVANQFGSPLRDHVAIFHEKERSVNDISLRRRYGIHTLYIREFQDIPEVLSDCLSVAGPYLSKHLDLALSKDPDERARAHQHFATLGPAGRKIASNALKIVVDESDRVKDSFALSEAAYSLGIIDARANKDVVMSIVETAEHSDPAGRALTVLRPVLTMDDISQIEKWLERFSAHPLAGEYPERIQKYLEYLLTYIPAKFRS